MSQADPVYRKVEKTLAKRHVALRIQIFLTFCVFAINLGVSCWLTSRNGTINGSGTIFTGNCDKAAALSIWLHLVINICSTILLGCSNYCMQLLSSPTREEVDTAHEKHTCMDIGAPSVRNLLRLQRKYGVVWLALCLSSSVLHLL